jgi:uncharacterized protein (TIGR03083 family)
MTLDFLTHLRIESDRFLALLRGADPAAAVPSCPEWTADDLLWHLAEVQWFWGTIVDERLQDDEPAEEKKPARPGGHAGLLAFFEESTELLQSALAAADPAERVWMWSDDKTVGYIRRRQAHEALIHRLDAELTVGAVTPLDTALASDGVHEALTKMFGGVPEWGTFTDSGRRVAVATTDTGLVVPLLLGHWKGTSPNTGNSYDEPICEVAELEGFSADATVRGEAAALDAWLWGRKDAAALDVDGDRAAFEQLQHVVSQGIS